MPACALPVRKVFPPPRPSPYNPTSDYKVSVYSKYFIMHYGMLAKNLITTPYKFVSPSQLLKEITSVLSLTDLFIIYNLTITSKISNPPQSPFSKGGFYNIPLFFKEGAGEITKNISSLLNSLSGLMSIYLWDSTLV